MPTQNPVELSNQRESKFKALSTTDAGDRKQLVGNVVGAATIGFGRVIGFVLAI